ncbi:MAG: hypothetical protein V4671_27500 [Armatimonadota bacterium]
MTERSRNSLWQIAFGDYDFALDRRTLTYNLTETRSGTVWSDGLSVGWLELENRENGERTRHSFADMKLVSLSEKSGQQGKRILLGLDCQGIPVDLYFICSQKEIQLTVEANRDSRTHRVHEICLLPGLVSVPDDSVSYLVLPHYDGAVLHAADTPRHELDFPLWSIESNVKMPFVGAVRNRTYNEPISALALITDSAYGAFHLSRQDDRSASVKTRYKRDPERRRLDIRLVVLPEQNYVGVARAYRNKIITDRNHITLRQKMREKPQIEKLLGSAFIVDQSAPCNSLVPLIHVRHYKQTPADAICLAQLDEGISAPGEERESLWDVMENQLQILEESGSNGVPVGAEFSGDWSALACDFWLDTVGPSSKGLFRASIPLAAVIYHDSVVMPLSVESPNLSAHVFLSALVRLATLSFIKGCEASEGHMTTLGHLHKLSFAAFLSEHRFLTPNFTVEEARYTNGAYILINQSETETFENERVTLPPLGFYVEHPQMIAHDALRVGEERFASRAFRVRRSQDGKPLTESADVLWQEFPV